MGMREKAYCPYSKFRVGAALLTHNNRFYTGEVLLWSTLVAALWHEL